MTAPLFMSDEAEAKAQVLAADFFREIGLCMPDGARDQPEDMVPQTQLAFCFQSLISAAGDTSSLTIVGAMQGIGLAIGAILANVPDIPTRQILVSMIQGAANTAIEVNGRIHQSEGNA